MSIPPPPNTVSTLQHEHTCLDSHEQRLLNELRPTIEQRSLLDPSIEAALVLSCSRPSTFTESPARAIERVNGHGSHHPLRALLPTPSSTLLSHSRRLEITIAHCLTPQEVYIPVPGAQVVATPSPTPTSCGRAAIHPRTSKP